MTDISWSYTELINGPIGLLGLSITIIGGFIYVVKHTWKLFKFFATQRKEASARLDAEIEKQDTERLEAAGKTVSARTDLGFFVLVELSSLRGALDSEKHTNLLSALLTVGIFVIFFEAASPESQFSQVVPPLLRIFILVAPFLTILMVVAELFAIKKQERFIRSYQKRVQAIWREPIEKRTKNKPE